jgi:hypothetical protein
MDQLSEVEAEAEAEAEVEEVVEGCACSGASCPSCTTRSNGCGYFGEDIGARIDWPVVAEVVGVIVWADPSPWSVRNFGRISCSDGNLDVYCVEKAIK